MKKIILLLAIAALGATGCRSTDDNGTNNTTSQYQNPPPQNPGTMNNTPVP